MRKIKKYQFPAGPLTTGNKLFDGQLAVQRSSYDFNKSLKSMQSSLYPKQQNLGGFQFTVGDASTGFTPQITQTTPFGTNTTNMLTGATTTNYNATPLTTNTSSKAPADNSGGNPGSSKGAALGAIAGGVGSIMNGIGDQLYSMGGYDKNSANAGAKDTRGAISDAAINSGVPIAMAIGAATKVVDGIMDATGLRAENISKRDANKVGISGFERFMNNFNNFLPGNPLALGGSQLSESQRSQDTEKLRGAYTGTLDDMDTAQTYGGRRLSFFSNWTGARGKMEDFIREQNRRNLLLTDIGRTNTLRKLNDYGLDIERQNFKRYNGESYQTTAIGKQGMKLLSKEELSRIYAAKPKKLELSPISKLQNGGSILIPEGALHARKHHMEEENPELAKEVTPKGIPVVITDDKGVVKQVAEIEKEEIILEKPLTDQIEALWKDGSEEAMIKAGKIIAYTMFKNCDDNTNLIEKTE